MFTNGVEVISSKLGNIRLDFDRNMQPKAERPPVGPQEKLPQLHLTPSNAAQKKGDGSPQQNNNPWLLKPSHDIPSTPPPQRDPQPFFQQRMG